MKNSIKASPHKARYKLCPSSPSFKANKDSATCLKPSAPTADETHGPSSVFLVLSGSLAQPVSSTFAGTAGAAQHTIFLRWHLQRAVAVLPRHHRLWGELQGWLQPWAAKSHCPFEITAGWVNRWVKGGGGRAEKESGTDLWTNFLSRMIEEQF